MAPRTANKEADALANGSTEMFSPAYECRVDPKSIDWVILDQALELGRRAEEEVKRNKEAGYDPGRAVRHGRKRKPADRLRVKDPW